MDKKYDIIGRELQEKDKIIFLWKCKGHINPQRAYITRFSEKCTFICFAHTIKYWKNEKNKKDKRKWEFKTINTTRNVLKHDWEKEWFFNY